MRLLLKLIAGTTVTLLLIGMVLMREMGDRSGGRLIAQIFTQNVNAGEWDKEDWKAYRFENLKLQSPLVLKPGPSPIDQVPDDVKSAVQSWKIYQVTTEDGAINFQVSHVTYKPEVEITLDGANEGAVQGAANSLGDEDPKYKTRELKVSGHDARRVLYKTTQEERKYQVHLLTILDGQELWQIVLVTVGDTWESEMSRVLDSVQLEKKRAGRPGAPRKVESAESED